MIPAMTDLFDLSHWQDEWCVARNMIKHSQSTVRWQLGFHQLAYLERHKQNFLFDANDDYISSCIVVVVAEPW